MKINRQYLLLGLLALMALANVADWAVTSLLQGPLQERRARQKQLQEEIAKHQKTLKDTRDAGKKIASWQAQSLPADREVARSFYRSWLVELLTESGFESPFVDSGSPLNRSGLYVAFPFTGRGQATLEQLTKFLYRFDQAGFLHRLQTITVTPRSSSGRFDVAVTIEALQLPGAPAREPAVAPETNRLASVELADYSAVSRQNIFGVQGALADPLGNTFVTAIVESDGQPEVWISQRLIDRTERLQIGDSMDVDGTPLVVLQILERDVVLDMDGRRMLLTVGENLAEAFDLPPEI